MRFRDIPKFHHPHYRANQDFVDLLGAIDRFTETHNLDLDPDFQRGHVWTEKQQIKYVEYLLKDGLSGRDIYFNHPGWMSDWKGRLVIVDGKQRLEACCKFLRNQLKVFGHYCNQFTDRLPNSGLVFHVNTLKTRAELLQWYLDLNDGGVVHTSQEIKRVRRLLETEQSR